MFRSTIFLSILFVFGVYQIFASECKSAQDCRVIPTDCLSWASVHQRDLELRIRTLMHRANKPQCKRLYVDRPEPRCEAKKCAPEIVTGSDHSPSLKLIGWAKEVLKQKSTSKAGAKASSSEENRNLTRALEVIQYLPSTVVSEKRKVDRNNRVLSDITYRYYSVCMDLYFAGGILLKSAVIPKCNSQF